MKIKFKTMNDIKAYLDEKLKGQEIRGWERQVSEALAEVDPNLSCCYGSNHDADLTYCYVHIGAIKYHAKQEKHYSKWGYHTFVTKFFSYFDVTDGDRDIEEYVQKVKEAEKEKAEIEEEKSRIFNELLKKKGFECIGDLLDFINTNATKPQRSIIKDNIHRY